MIKNILLFSLVIVALYSCRNYRSSTKNVAMLSYQETKLPNDITQLWVSDGNKESDTVLIISQGGPKWELDIVKHGKTNYRYIPKYKDLHIVFVHQSQTFNKTILESEKPMTFNEAKDEAKKSTEILDRAITYFKEQDKTVIVLGKSYGAFIIQDYLSSYRGAADKYILIAGRITVNKEMTDQHLKGFNGNFDDDGLTFLPEEEVYDPEETKNEINNYRKKQFLKAAYGIKDYSQLLKNIDLSNVIYFYGTIDQNVGRLRDPEIRFLTSKGVQVISAKKDHSGILYTFVDQLADHTLKL